jgi:predicted nucleotidyltransferase component of viral defense system
MINIKDLTTLICQSDPQLSSLKTTVEKELLHYEIMMTLAENGFLKQLTFQGGTCLRMMYGSNRLSEDLDFAGGHEFDFRLLENLRDCLHSELSKKHNLKINISQPDFDKLNQQQNVKVGRWKVSIETAPEDKSAPWQKIRLEIATVPAHSANLRPMVKAYPQLPDGYQTVLVNCESLAEIAADKYVALALRKTIKARDVWDLAWLYQQRVEASPQLVMQKFSDYQSDNGIERLSARLSEVPQYIESGYFVTEMERFLLASVAQTSIRQKGFNDYVKETVVRQGKKLFAAFSNADSSPFKM